MSRLVLVAKGSKEPRLPERTTPTMIETIDQLERLEKRCRVVCMFGGEIHVMEQPQARGQSLSKAKAVRVTTLQATSLSDRPHASRRAVSLGGNVVAIGRDRAAALSVALSVRAPVVQALPFHF